MGQKNYIECPFCSGLVEAKPGRLTCPECRAGLTCDESLRHIFADTDDMRLPIHGTVCTRCGLVQSEKASRCVHCQADLVGTRQ